MTDLDVSPPSPATSANTPLLGQLASSGPSERSWYNVLGFSADATANILSDGLLVYRCYIIWNRQWHVLAILMLIYLASSVLAVITVVASALPHMPLFNGKLQLGVPWFSLSVGLNILITSMICFRLLQMKARMRKALIEEISDMYTNIAVMLIESAAVFSVLGIVLIVMAARNEPLTFAFSHVWTMFSSLSPQMIILRVSMGHGWLRETDKDSSTALVLTQPTTLHVGSVGVRITTSSICDTEGPIYYPQAPAADGFDIPIKGHMSTAGVEC